MRIESKATLEKLGLLDKAFVARKFALTTFVDLAGTEAPVTIVTREGESYDITELDQYYCAIGNNGDVWPVEKSFFDQNYERSECDYKAMWEDLARYIDNQADSDYMQPILLQDICDAMVFIENHFKGEI